jgi:hypothetical protein
VEVVRVAGQTLQLQLGAMMPDLERKLIMDSVQSRGKGVEEEHPAKRAEGVALGTPTGGNPGIVGDRVHTLKRRFHILVHPVGGRQMVGKQGAQIG